MASLQVKQNLNQDDKIRAYQLLKNYFQSLGVPVLQSGFIAAQVLYETADGSSRLSREDNNYSGIKFAKQQGATKGRPANDGGNYAHFNSAMDWARTMLNRVSKGPGYPLKASNLPDYVNRLKVNKYFTDDTLHYYNGVRSKYLAYENASKLSMDPSPSGKPTSAGVRFFDMGPLNKVTDKILVKSPNANEAAWIKANPEVQKLNQTLKAAAEDPQRWWQRQTLTTKLLLVGTGVFLIARR